MLCVVMLRVVMLRTVILAVCDFSTMMTMQYIHAGMNFDYMPELHWHYSYYIFWVIVIATTVLAAAWVRGSFTSGMVSNRPQRMDI
jgi:magnesium transporter